MADNQKYFYMRMKEDFFDSEEIVILESMPDGIIYENILLKMYCKSLKSEGRLMFNGVIPYSPSMLASITRQQVGTVEKALDILAKLGLIEILDNGAIYMMNIQNYIGASSSEADRKREYYNLIQEEKRQISEKSPENSPQISENSSRDIYYKDISISTSTATSKYKNGEKSPKTTKFVKPTIEEINAYAVEKGYNVDAEYFFNYYESKGWMVGKSPMKNWKATIANWAKRDYLQQPKKETADETLRRLYEEAKRKDAEDEQRGNSQDIDPMQARISDIYGEA